MGLVCHKGIDSILSGSCLVRSGIELVRFGIKLFGNECSESWIVELG